MTVKTYSTDTECPSCGADLYHSLLVRVFSEAMTDFQVECVCGTLLEITVEAVPSFSILIIGQQAKVTSASEESA